MTRPAKRPERVSDEEMSAIKITREEFHGEWNYSIYP